MDMGWFWVLRIGVSDLHHSSGTVGIVAREAVRCAEAGITAEDVGAAVFPAEDSPFGEYGKAAQRSRAVVADGGIGQNLVVECNVDAIMIAIKCHGFYFDSGVQKLRTAHLCAGTGIQNGLRTGGQIDPQVFNPVLVAAGFCNFASVNGHRLFEVLFWRP